jgi:dihydroorotase
MKAKIIKPEYIEEAFRDFVASNPEYDNGKYTVMPGFCDVHVHFREPGFSYKETIRTGCMAAVHGGYTTVCTMPNLNPVPDSVEHLAEETDIIERDSIIDIRPYGSITKEEKGKELSDMAELNDKVVAFSDDGRGVQDTDVMRMAMRKAKSLDKIIAAHCEVDELLHGGYINDGEYARLHGHSGISNSSEYKEIERDIELAGETGCKYHVCHVSTKESVDLVRQAKKKGWNVTCEATPHHLLLDESCLQEDGRFKVNPPIRTAEDRLAVVEGLRDGTVDIIATDHAPHTDEEKSRGLKDSPNGITGLENAFQVLYTDLVLNNVITLDELVDKLAVSPRKRFSIPFDGSFTVWDLNEAGVINSKQYFTKGHMIPFDGKHIYGSNVLTVYKGQVVYRR